jgi:hypothetical protein
MMENVNDGATQLHIIAVGESAISVTAWTLKNNDLAQLRI